MDLKWWSKWVEGLKRNKWLKSGLRLFTSLRVSHKSFISFNISRIHQNSKKGQKLQKAYKIKYLKTKKETYHQTVIGLNLLQEGDKGLW